MTQTNLTRPQGLNRIDPALRDAAIEHGTFEFRPETLPAEREQADRLAAERAAAVDTSGVTVETRSITGPGGHQLNLRFYRGPDLDQAKSASPLVLYAHGGGFVTGNLDTDHAQCVELAKAGGCLLVSVDYRLAPENKCPAALDDVEAGFYYAIRNSAALIDISPLFKYRVTGSSVMARWLPPAFQHGVDIDAVDSAVDMPYDIPNRQVEYVRAEPPAVPTGFWRGVGPNNNVFAIECFMDELARKAGKDPIEFRKGMLGKTPRLLAALNLVAEKSNWAQPLQAPQARPSLGLRQSASRAKAVANNPLPTPGCPVMSRP